MKLRLLIILLLSGPVALGQSPVRAFMQQVPSKAGAVAYGNNPKAGRYLQAGDARIYYEVYGVGKPVVVLHGGVFGSTCEMAPFIDSLSKTNQVIAISTRGHDKSGMGSQTPSYERKAQDVAMIISQETKDSVIVLGFSDGAYTGFYLAGMHPEKVRKLIGIGAGERKKGFRKFGFDRKMLWGMDSLYFKQQLALMPEPERFDQWLAQVNQYYNQGQVGKQILGAIRCPVLVMAGENDRSAPLQTVLAAYHMIPDAQLTIIPDAPHPVFMTHFAAVWTSMLPFLKP